MSNFSKIIYFHILHWNTFNIIYALLESDKKWQMMSLKAIESAELIQGNISF